MVNLQDTPTAGPLTERDLDEARRHSTGAIYAAEACTEVGADKPRTEADEMFCAWFWRCFLAVYVVALVVLVNHMPPISG